MYRIKQPHTEKEFEDYYQLRWQVLRKPWQQPKDSEKDELESESFHIIACDESNRVVGVGRLHFNADTEAQIRYMAIKPEYEHNGIGKLIAMALEEHAEEKTCNVIVIEAREPAIGFYEKLGYKAIEKSYVLFDSIQHYRMSKTILA